MKRARQRTARKLYEVIPKQDAEYWAKYSIQPPSEMFKRLLAKGGEIRRDKQTGKYYAA